MAEDLEEIEESEGGSKLPLILGIVAALILGLGGGFAASTMMGGGDEEAEEDTGMMEVAAEGEEGDPSGRSIYPLGLFTVNLRGVGGGRVLRVEIELEVATLLMETMEHRRAGLRDATIKLISDFSFTDIEGLDGKLRLQDQLLTQLNQHMGRRGRIERVYFSQFVVQ